MLDWNEHHNPLLSGSSDDWDSLIEAVGPASILVVIESRLSPSLRRHFTAEDVFQEALLHAWRDRAACEWRGLKSFRSWLLSIVDHRIGHLAAAAATQKRGAGVHVTAFSAFQSASPADGGSRPSDFPGPTGSTTPSRIAVFREQAEAMQQALSEVPDEFSEVVRLRLFEQLTLNEIANRMELGLSIVRRRFGRGVEIYERALRNALISRSRSRNSAGQGRSRS